MNKTIKRIVVVGGGFGGVYAAKQLEKIFKQNAQVEIVLISEKNYLLFSPMLPEVPASSIEAKHIVSPIRTFFRKVKFQNSSVEAIDLERRQIKTSHCSKCGSIFLKYDYLVLAAGSVTNYFGLPGVAENALPMKKLEDAMALRNHVIDLLEHADMETAPEIRRKMLTFVVAGGGFAGAETAAELQDFLTSTPRFYPNILPEECRVVLVHAGERLLPEISTPLADYALAQLQKNKIEVLLKTRVDSAGSDVVVLDSSKKIQSKTLIWTSGTTPNPILATLPCLKNKRGQIVVNEYLEVPDFPGVYALGDAAEIPDPYTGKYYPPTAQHAVREAKRAAKNIAADIGNGTKKPFRFKPLGMLAALGHHSAVAEVFGIRFSGFFAWWLWRTIYLLKLPNLLSKLRVAIDWTLDLFFPRDILLLETFIKNKLPVRDNGFPKVSADSAAQKSHPLL
jgi:NADH dehydrogenase